MIKIIETSTPIKISGLSSLLVTFDFNQYIVDSLKTIPTYYYHKAIQTWEFPVCYLSRLLDSLTFLDDIQLQLLDESFISKSQYNLKPLLKLRKFHLR